MKKLRIGLIIVAIIIIIVELILIEYKNLFDSKNIGPFLVMLSMILLTGSLILSIKRDKELNEKN
jgi:hypothetical protein